MKRAWIIGIIFVLAVAAWGQIPDSCEAKYAQVRERQLTIVDSLYRAVLYYYPLEILDTVVWRDSCEVLRGRIQRSTYHDYVDLPLEISSLLHDLTGQWLLLSRYVPLSACELFSIASDMKVIFGDCVFIDITRSEFPKLLWTSGGGGNGYADALDTSLSRVRGAHGLFLSINALGNSMTVTDALAAAGRFIRSRTEFIRGRIREPNSSGHRDTVFSAVPTGEWQYDRPLVVFVDSTVGWPSRVFIEALRHGRRYVEIVGEEVPAPMGIMPRNVELPGGTVVSIPTAYALTMEGEPLGSLRPDFRRPKPPLDPYSEFEKHENDTERILQDLVRRYQRERVDRMEDMFRK